ncbi:TPA: hypothetical protein ACJIN0_004153, partial [Escherichia coli]
CLIKVSVVNEVININGIYYEFACGIKRPEIFSGTFMSGKAFVARCGVNALSGRFTFVYQGV